jgi:D-lactate dehydrogenase (cytochrome)
VYPETTEDVSAVVKVCVRHGAPIIPFGIGSSLEGHVNAIRGGVSIDLTRMTKVLRLSPDDMDITVEAGLTHRKLNAHLKNTGLMFMVDPGADATIGGMTATRASGTAAVRYGTMRETVLGLTVVLADGRIVTTGGRARKSSSGYDLTRLFVGSEGTLGVITEVTLRLYGRPEAMSTAVCGFQTMEGAAATVIQTIQLGVPVARIEIIDEVQLGIVNRFSKTSLPEVPTLLFEFHGPSPAVVEEHARLVREVADEHGVTSFQWTASAEERAKLWEARHNVLYATIASRPGCKAWTSDVCVPIAHLAECIVETQKDLAASNLVAPLVGHAGDGNFHLIFMLDPDDPEELARVAAANHRLVERALSFGGTCSGEHGVGMGKLKYLEREHGEDALELMRTIKRAVDPANLMNPGKLVPGL